MADATSTITKLINSPPGQLVAGGVLFGIVWGFFKNVESVLTDDTKLEIAVWLLGLKKFGPKVEPWPDTFARMFDRVFGAKHLSWKCFCRSAVASIMTGVLTGPHFLHFLIDATAPKDLRQFTAKAGTQFVLFYLSVSVIPDHISLFETRLILRLMRRSQGSLWVFL